MHTISLDAVRTLSDQCSDIAVSIYMPTEKAGKETTQNQIRFKNLVREAERQIQARHALRAAELSRLLAPAQGLIESSRFWQHQETGLAVFMNNATLVHYQVPVEFDELVVVADRFYVKPLVRVLTGDGRFYVLSLNRRKIELFEATRHGMTSLDLGDTPTDMREVESMEPEERHLQWRTAAPAGRGGRAVQFHGHGEARDAEKPELRKFFSAVDRGMREIIPDASIPLVLAGLDQLLPIYREVSDYPSLVDEEIRQNPADLSTEQLHARAWSLVEPRFVREVDDAERRFRELSGSGRTSDSLEEIVPATADGRVDVLFLARRARAWGSYDRDRREVVVSDQARNGDRELLDLMAVEALSHRGKVFVVDPDRLPSGEGLAAAIFRY